MELTLRLPVPDARTLRRIWVAVLIVIVVGVLTEHGAALGVTFTLGGR